VIEGIIFRLLGNLGGDTVKQILSWFPVANTGYLASSFGNSLPAALARTVAKPIADANHAVLVLVLYTVFFIAGSVLLIRARDVTN
jgi:hypothetical protein